jgi:MFS family permease
MATAGKESRWRAVVSVAAICCGNAGPALVYDALAPVLPNIAAHFGGGLQGEGVAQASVALAVVGMGLAGLFTAPVVARFGFRRTLIAGWLTFGIAGSAGLLIDAATPLLATRLVLGLMGGMLMASAGLGIAARYDAADRPRMMGVNLAVGAFTAILFLFVAAAVAKVSWRAPFALHGALGLVGLLLVASARLPDAAAPVRERRDIGGFWRALLPALPAYALLLVMVLTGNLFNVQIVFLLASRGFADPGMLATMCAIMPVALGITNIGFGAMEAHLGLVRTIVASLLLFVGGTALCGASPSLVTTGAGMIAGGIALGLCTPSAMTLIMRGVEPARMPTALSFATTLIYVGGGSAPLLWVPLRGLVGHPGIYLCAGGAILAGLLLWSVRRMIVRPAPLRYQGSI